MSSFFRSVGSDSDSSSSSSDEEELLSSGDESDQGLAATAAGAPKPRRNLLAGGDSDSDDDSDDDDDDDDEDDGEGHAQAQQAAAKPVRSRFLKGGSDDDSSDDEAVKVVKSARSKRLDEVDASVKSIDNAVKINDWSAVSNEFDKLVRLISRQANVSEPIPANFIKTLVSLEDACTKALAAGQKKKMNATNARALNSMKQKLKKTAREHESQVNKCRADPDAFEAEAAKLAAGATAAALAGPRRARGDRSTTTTSAPGAAAADSTAPGQRDEDDGFETVGSKGKAIAITPESVFKSLQAVLEQRGKKNTDRAEQVKVLERLLAVAASPYAKIRVLLALISSLLDYNPATHAFMPLELWASAERHVDALLALLEEHAPAYVVREDAPDYDDAVERNPDTEQLATVVVRGSVISLVERLDDEFTKSLQAIDPHTDEYVDRLKDERALYAMVVRAMRYFERVDHDKDHLDRVVFRRLEHIYCKPDVVTQTLEQSLPAPAKGGESHIWETPPTTTTTTTTTPKDNTKPGSLALVRALCVHMYKTDVSLLRTRAMLCHIYHYALHDAYHTARDMLLMSHLQDTIGGADVTTQILYNRTVVQLGLCAFRLGLIREAQALLQEIFATQRVKELLAQGVQAQRYSVLSPEQEKLERQRQLPFHMHINLELLECVYLVASMLVEIPLLAQAGADPELRKKAPVSRTFRRMLDYAERQVFQGPPENKRDCVMQAARALQQGDWHKTVELVNAIKVWSLMPASTSRSASSSSSSQQQDVPIREMLKRKIQEQGLRTYLFTYAGFFESISLAHLAQMFELSHAATTSIVSKLIWHGELAGSLARDHVVLHSVERTQLHKLALQLAERVGHMADQSERHLDAKVLSAANTSSSSTAGDEGKRAEGAGGEGSDARGSKPRRGGGGGGGGRGGRGGSRGRGAAGRFNAQLGRSVAA